MPLSANDRTFSAPPSRFTRYRVPRSSAFGAPAEAGFLPTSSSAGTGSPRPARAA
jgi:hypothetical protein